MSRASARLTAVLVVAGALVACPPVHAEPSAPTAEAEARARYDEGIVRYALGDLAGAVESWRAAYALVPTPALLFNIAQAYRQMGEPKRALFAYRAYLRQAPDAANRDEVAARIAELEASPTLVMADAAPPRTTTGSTRAAAVVVTPSSTSGPRRALIAGIASSAVAGAVSIGVGVGFSVRANRAAEAIDNAPPGAPWSDAYGARYDDGRRSAAAATAFFVIGGAALAGSAIVAAVGRKTLARRSNEPSRPILSAASLRWTF